MRNRWMLIFTFLAVGQVLGVGTAAGQIRDLRELNTLEIKALNPQRTVIIIPGGILEEHGPYLPSFTDGYVNEYLARRVAESIIARPGWTVLMFPMIPLGDGGANQVGKHQQFPGTYHLHFATLRAVFMDLASEFGEAGFRWLFVISQHGALKHQLALDEASDYFSETYGGKMVHLTGLVSPTPVLANVGLSPDEQRENGLDVHAGMNETSRILFLRPELVRPGYASATPEAGASWRELVDRGARADWPGYFGSPRIATAWRGGQILNARAQELSQLATRILDGFDHQMLERSADRQLADAAIREYNEAADEHARAIEEKQAAWLRRKGLR